LGDKFMGLVSVDLHLNQRSRTRDPAASPGRSCRNVICRALASAAIIFFALIGLRLSEAFAACDPDTAPMIPLSTTSTEIVPAHLDVATLNIPKNFLVYRPGGCSVLIETIFPDFVGRTPDNLAIFQRRPLESVTVDVLITSRRQGTMKSFFIGWTQKTPGVGNASPPIPQTNGLDRVTFTWAYGRFPAEAYKPSAENLDSGLSVAIKCGGPMPRKNPQCEEIFLLGNLQVEASFNRSLIDHWSEIKQGIVTLLTRFAST
jgi:hypothetical protein